ncbi:hypothetical protein CDL15_Pgr010379 [Punica granatum]|uniref:SHSP domain-containing protein n=1 Tax=Punica granatum TaxID=22663 RepID=A0A218W2N6_PUNGR|nr:hypothetical protein CDL15_Pgr010379 [Punica granatum]PKI32275.1 hypothetical protein CRG98_047361 [Punica granatum]
MYYWQEEAFVVWALLHGLSHESVKAKVKGRTLVVKLYQRRFKDFPAKTFEVPSNLDGRGAKIAIEGWQALGRSLRAGCGQGQQEGQEKCCHGH